MTSAERLKLANELVNSILAIASGPIRTKADAVKLVDTALREAFYAGQQDKPRRGP